VSYKPRPCATGYDAWLAFGSRDTANQQNEKPKEPYGYGIQRDINGDAYSGHRIAKEIVLMTVSHDDNEPGWL
jgi:hypothetical protein